MRIKDARQNFLGIWLRRALEGDAFEVWGGEQRRELLYVDDAVEAFLLAALQPARPPGWRSMSAARRRIRCWRWPRRWCGRMAAARFEQREFPGRAQAHRYRRFRHRRPPLPRADRVGAADRARRGPEAFARLLPPSPGELCLTSTMTLASDPADRSARRLSRAQGRRSTPRSPGCSAGGQYILGPRGRGVRGRLCRLARRRPCGRRRQRHRRDRTGAARLRHRPPATWSSRCRTPRSRPSRRSSAPARCRCWSISSPAASRWTRRRSKRRCAPAARPAGRGPAGASLRRAGRSGRRSCALARRHGLRVIEDCAQSHGALYRGRPTGSIGDIACFSFYPTKNLGALGDAGMTATDDAALATALREVREYGWRDRYVSARIGINTRLDPIQAAILGGQAAATRGRQRAPPGDRRSLRRGPRRPAADLAARGAPSRTHVFHQYVIRSPAQTATGCASICAGRRSAPACITRCRCICSRPMPAGSANTPPACRRRPRAMREILSLPIYPQLGEAAADRVIREIRRFFE